jgi:hypothetical protein
MGTALLIIAEVFGWGVVLIGFAALVESGWARLRRGRQRTLTQD